MDSSFLKENERIDDLGRGGYRVIQNPDRFCFGVDAALLAWFAKVQEGERVLDLCTGSGVVMFLTEARNRAGTYIGLEIQPVMAEMAARSVSLNGAEDRMAVECGDLKTASERFGKASFDVITVNPPYKRAGSGLMNPDEGKAIARHELLCTLDDVLRESMRLLKSGGRFYMVHRPGRLAEILEKMRAYRIAPAELIPVYSYRDQKAALILISGIRGGRNELKCLPPVVIYREKNVYTEESIRIYRE